MSVENVKRIAANMTELLTEKYPMSAEEYNTNLGLFNTELDSLHVAISKAMQDLKSREFIIYHPALTYFARDYGLVQVPIEQEGKEPSARYLKTLIDQAKTNGIKAILVQKQFNQQEAKTIENQIDGKLISIDPLAENWMDQMLYITVELNTVLR
jgi:zinc transport system substrate-binding protein